MTVAELRRLPPKVAARVDPEDKDVVIDFPFQGEAPDEDVEVIFVEVGADPCQDFLQISDGDDAAAALVISLEHRQEVLAASAQHFRDQLVDDPEFLAPWEKIALNYAIIFSSKGSRRIKLTTFWRKARKVNEFVIVDSTSRININAVQQYIKVVTIKIEL